MSPAVSLIKDSCTPLAYEDNACLAMFAEAFVKGVMKRLARCVAADPAAHALFALCNEMAGSAMLRNARAWQPELGACLDRMKRQQPLEAAVQALFAMHALRVPGVWSLAPPGTMRASMGGHIFDLAGQVQVQGDGERLQLRRSDIACAPLVFAYDGARWRLAAPAAQAWRHVAPSSIDYRGFESCYVQAWSLPDSHRAGDDLLVDWPPQPADAIGAQLASQAAHQLGDALALLEQAGPRYLPWLRPVMRGIAACPVYAPGLRVSASFPNHFGVISAAFPLTTAYLAEILVHEFSHQYYLLLEAVMPLVKKEVQPQLYYSSFKMKQRPLGKILLTYHATANMALFWHDLHANGGAGNPLYRAELENLLHHTDSLGAIIASSNGLTEAGEAMFETQRELLGERDLLGCGA
jgi:HEXXH motif-containing protein